MGMWFGISGRISNEAIPVVMFTASMFENKVFNPLPCFVNESMEYHFFDAVRDDLAKISERIPREYDQFITGEKRGIFNSFNLSMSSLFGCNVAKLKSKYFDQASRLLIRSLSPPPKCSKEPFTSKRRFL